MKEDTKKTTINLPIKLYEEIKKKGDNIGINFNAMIIIELNKILEQEKQIELLNKTVNMLEQKESKE